MKVLCLLVAEDALIYQGLLLLELGIRCDSAMLELLFPSLQLQSSPLDVRVVHVWLLNLAIHQGIGVVLIYEHERG